MSAKTSQGPLESPHPPAEPTPGARPSEVAVIDALQTVFDPEIPVNIYALGLIYDLDIGDDGHVDVRMTLTAPGCPVAGEMPGQVEAAVRTVEGVRSVKVELVWDPPWSPELMSEEARLELNML
jgi:FeS assembly SUF system protein